MRLRSRTARREGGRPGLSDCTHWSDRADAAAVPPRLFRGLRRTSNPAPGRRAARGSPGVLSTPPQDPRGGSLRGGVTCLDPGPSRGLFVGARETPRRSARRSETGSRGGRSSGPRGGLDRGSRGGVESTPRERLGERVAKGCEAVSRIASGRPSRPRARGFAGRVGRGCRKAPREEPGATAGGPPQVVARRLTGRPRRPAERFGRRVGGVGREVPRSLLTHSAGGVSRTVSGVRGGPGG